ncbi:TIGR03960 family B12-binding radical SAM protein [Desulforamulus ferrireducens]|uniref:B12-binding domain-containing radical SAM protein n=1 Tax=Desulforamulus ferrireducens TaxID=1833852 RepID=A0A1S6IYV1_9FIRM|nr:TIGR03960 family B12-binding radical SAM protein [Desulforamulus ferrireducens]AQS59953.1 B12-binding domain-containing radical SAM protein [Desulforamulus ferrireducens]
MNKLDKILVRVQKPARYVGGEWNAVKKDWEQTSVKMVFAFPDVYEVGMSHLGLQILYHIVNKRKDALMERVFAPWVDMEKELRKEKMLLFSLESQRPLIDFDIIGFTLQYEMSFSNILNMLDLAGLPVRSAHRDASMPLVIAGGPCAFNPEPIADFIDLFVIGEGEEVINELLDAFRELRDQGVDRPTMLKQLAKIPGIYVPSLYTVQYNEDNTIAAVTPLHEDVPAKIGKRIVRDFDQVDFPTKPIVPTMGVVHDRVMVEVLRGCTRGCRFCQAGVLYRPVREKTPETLVRQVEEMINNTGHDEISLTSLSTADYTGVAPLVKNLLDIYGERGVNVSLPSLRLDAFSIDLAKEVQKVRKSGLTFAPEAGTQRLRDVINKNVTEQNLVDAVTSAFQNGWSAVKLYFMIGLPTETYEDLDGIANMAKKVVQIGYQCGVPKGRLKVTVSTSSFVPKAHTAFQWEPQNTLEELQEKQRYLKEKLRDKRISYNYHDSHTSFLEAVFAKGDRRLGAVLETAWTKGARFDGWSELFNYELWLEAFAQENIDPKWYAYREIPYEEVLPWDHLDAGVSKRFLMREHKKAMASSPTVDCRTGKCTGCGLCPTLEIKPTILGGADIEPIQGEI